ncbi:hypothetical protein RvY_08182-2 [Ramazzottius varieornatus]|uniref:HMG box domain-containing protein n=1 Tax=Ramazzottius varieornatus TaxID=947166 RepID=A0A1D1VD49_RAMVA|nr:hypothetical protein RvY_08182-2 [Ramazzottius varieornatus]
MYDCETADLTLVDDDWAEIMSYMMANDAADQSMASCNMPMTGPMNSGSSGVDIDFGGMFNDHSSSSQASLSHLNHSNQQQPPQQTTPQQTQMPSYDCYPHQQTQQYQSRPLQFMDQYSPIQSQQLAQLPQYSTSLNLPQNSNGMAYYEQCQPQHIQHPQSQDFGQTSPVYLVAQTVKNIDNFNFEHYASLPSITNTSLSHHIPQNVVRTLSSSSTGNSPSSQSPVSEEDYHDVTGSKTTAASRRKAEAPAQTKKKSVSKPRRRKRDPNEPTKPVSAYALFFRDKQANIKGSKPDATFGEVSKIVAQMWDNLDPEKKNMYKKRTEEAKKEYLQQLAVYRASLLNSPETLYMQPSFVSRSPPAQMTSYNRNMYSNNNSQHHNGLKIHLQNIPPQMNTTRSPPRGSAQDECLQITSGSPNEGRQMYSRVMDSEMVKHNYLASNHMTNVWESQIPMDGDGLVAHCKDTYTNWIPGQQQTVPNPAKVLI